jgi:hypothetical protein
MQLRVSPPEKGETYRKPAGTRTRNSQIRYRVVSFVRHVIRYDLEWTIATVIITDIHLPSIQAGYYSGPLHPQCDSSYWPSTTKPMALSPEYIPETSVPMTLAPGLSYDDLEQDFRAFADDQIRANGGRVSEHCGLGREKRHSR